MNYWDRRYTPDRWDHDRDLRKHEPRIPEMSSQQQADLLLAHWQQLIHLPPAERLARIDLIRRELGQPIDADCLLVVPMEAKR